MCVVNISISVLSVHVWSLSLRSGWRHARVGHASWTFCQSHSGLNFILFWICVWLKPNSIFPFHCLPSISMISSLLRDCCCYTTEDNSGIPINVHHDMSGHDDYLLIRTAGTEPSGSLQKGQASCRRWVYTGQWKGKVMHGHGVLENKILGTYDGQFMKRHNLSVVCWMR